MSDGIGLDGTPWGEPPSGDRDSQVLWSDIADELADHLACAERGETLGGACETQARERAIGRFGSPRSIALQLYWIAMKDKVIAYRSVAVGSVVVALAAVVAVFALVQRQNATGEQLQSLMAQLAEANDRVDPVEYEWGHVALDFGDIPDDAMVKATLRGPAFGGESVVVSEDADGSRVVFGPVHVGDYSANVRIHRPAPWGTVSLNESMTLYPGDDLGRQFEFPSDSKLVPVRIVVDWPDDLLNEGLGFALTMRASPIASDDIWKINAPANVFVGPKGLAHVETFDRLDPNGPGMIPSRVSEELFPSGVLSDWGDTVMLPAGRRYDPEFFGRSGVVPPDASIEGWIESVSGIGPFSLPNGQSGWPSEVFDWMTVPKLAGDDGVIEWTLELSDDQWDLIRRRWQRYGESAVEVDIPWPSKLAEEPIAIIASIVGHSEGSYATRNEDPRRRLQPLWSTDVALTAGGVAAYNDAGSDLTPRREAIQKTFEPGHESVILSTRETAYIVVEPLWANLFDESKLLALTDFPIVQLPDLSPDPREFKAKLPDYVWEAIERALAERRGRASSE